MAWLRAITNWVGYWRFGTTWSQSQAMATLPLIRVWASSKSSFKLGFPKGPQHCLALKRLSLGTHQRVRLHLCLEYSWKSFNCFVSCPCRLRPRRLWLAGPHQCAYIYIYHNRQSKVWHAMPQTVVVFNYFATVLSLGLSGYVRLAVSSHSCYPLIWFDDQFPSTIKAIDDRCSS